MGHAASPGLISTGLITDISHENSSFRWGIVISFLIHIFIVLMAIFIRFQSDMEHPLRAIEVSLVSLPTMEAPNQPPAKVIPKPAAPSKPTTVKPAQPPKIKEETLPPLPTNTASERLSDSIGGAVGSIKVPSRVEAIPPSSPEPSNETNAPVKVDRSPLFEKPDLPAAPPEIARAEPLSPSTPVTLPQKSPSTPKQSVSPVTPSLPKEDEPETVAEPVPQKPTIKPVPKPPTLSPAKPFARRKNAESPKTAPAEKSLEASIKHSIPSVPSRVAPAKPLKQATLPSQPRETTSIPTVAAPQLAPIPTAPPKEPISTPQREKLSDSMKQLLAGVKAPTFKSSPTRPDAENQPSETSPTPPPSPASSLKSEIDQQLAKLTIPDVAPVESIQKRLQLIQVQSSSGADSSTTQPTPGENRYLAMVKDEIDKRWVAPPLLESNPSVIVTFHIDKSGEISRVRVDQSSGNSYYDSAILRAINAVNPLPEFPPDLRETFLDIKFRFTKIEK